MSLGTASAPTPASTSSAVAYAFTPAPATSPSIGVHQRLAETTREEAPPEKRPRIEASSSSSLLALQSSSTTAASQPIWPAPWRPNLQVELGRPLTVEDRIAGDALVIAAVGRACALPRHMQRLREFDDVTLAVSLMQSAISVSFPQI